jgi:hypothetical protein
MVSKLGLALIVSALLAESLAAQASQRGAQRVIVTDNITPAQQIRTPLPTPTPVIMRSTPSPAPTIVGQPQPQVNRPVQPPVQLSGSNLTLKGGLTFAQMKSKIAEAKRFMISRPMTIASADPALQHTTVRVAFLDPRTKRIDYITLLKDDFLMKDFPRTAVSANGTIVTTRTIRGNGVNTPITITDMKGEPQLPLVVQYPVVREGKYIETAYYMSTHPGLITPEVVAAGQYYVRNVIDVARDNLKAKGHIIQPKIADWAERLATVEHVDHQRFRTEPHANIYNDVFALYALNEGQTYRYSVSSAGAGGMVQMIPWTYRMIRSRYPSANLMPDFVEGMRNHVNAAQAMLLYMQMTWNDLIARPTVADAIATGIAREEHLMAAGYNSNPAKLSGYISRGGAAWATLIPRETKIYLQIWDSLERTVQPPRTR